MPSLSFFFFFHKKPIELRLRLKKGKSCKSRAALLLSFILTVSCLRKPFCNCLEAQLSLFWFVLTPPPSLSLSPSPPHPLPSFFAGRVSTLDFLLCRATFILEHESQEKAEGGRLVEPPPRHRLTIRLFRDLHALLMPVMPLQ